MFEELFAKLKKETSHFSFSWYENSDTYNLFLVSPDKKGQTIIHDLPWEEFMQRIKEILEKPLVFENYRQPELPGFGRIVAESKKENFPDEV